MAFLSLLSFPTFSLFGTDKALFLQTSEWNISLARASDERILLAKCLTGRDFLDKSIVHASSL